MGVSPRRMGLGQLDNYPVKLATYIVNLEINKHSYRRVFLLY